MVTTGSPTQTTQEGRNQKDLWLLVSSFPSSNDDETSWFAPKSLLDAAIKLLSAPSPIKKIYPPQVSITIGKLNFRKIPSNLEYLTSEGKIPRSLKEVSMRFRKKICRKNLRQGPRISGESTRCQNRNWRQGWRSNKLRKPSNFVPITWSI